MAPAATSFGVCQIYCNVHAFLLGIVYIGIARTCLSTIYRALSKPSPDETNISRKILFLHHFAIWAFKSLDT